MKVGTDGVLLGSWAAINLTNPRMLDIGTGTGLIALMLAQKHANSIIDAIEIDEHAFKQAAENVLNSKLASQINVVHADVNEWFLQSTIKYDAIICNPPYFINGWIVDDAARKKARDAASLPYNLLVNAVNYLLNEKGEFFLILPIQEAQLFIALAEASKLHCIKATTVFTKVDLPPKRLLLQFSRNKQNTITDNLVIADKSNAYTADYKALTSEFYLNF